MKKVFTLAIAFILVQTGFAQENKLWLSLSSGLATTNNAGKNNLMGNGYNVQTDAFVPLYRKGWDGSVKGSGFALGINILGDYTGLKNLSPDNVATANQYQIFGGTMGVTSQSSTKMSGSFSGLAGLQARFSFGKFNFSPSLNAGYLHLKQQGYAQNGTAEIQGQSREAVLVKQDDQSTGGFAFRPQAKIGYNLTSRFSLFVSPSVIIGPEVKHTTQYLVPQGGFNDRKTYEAKQLANGTWESSTTTSRYGLTQLNFGLSVAIGAKKAPKTNVKPGGAVSSSYAKTVPGDAVTPTPNSVTDFNTTRNNHERGQLKKPDTLHQEWDNAIAGNISKVKNNADTTNGGMITKAGVSTSRSGIIRTGNAKLTESNSANTENTDTTTINQRLSMTPTTTKQTQGQNFGEKVASGLQSGANAVSQGASLLGGALGGGAVSSSYAAGRLSMTPTTTKQTQGKTFGEKVSSGLQTAPNITEPVGKSINEKGVSSTKSRRRVEVLKSNKTGDPKRSASKTKGRTYTGGRKNEPQGKSINEKGVNTTKGHKYEPEGKSINEKGVSSSKPQPKAKQKEKTKEKATSGMKDVIKTNV